MSNSEFSDFNAEVIDVSPLPGARKSRRRWAALVLALLAIFALLRAVNVYVEALWFDSLGYASTYWYTYGIRWALFGLFALATIGVLRGSFWMLERFFAVRTLERRTVVINNQPVNISPARVLRPLGWIVALVFGIGSGLSVSADWQTWVRYLHQPAAAVVDPIFGRPLGYYLFTLPVHQTIVSWLTLLAVIVLAATILYALLIAPLQLGNSITKFGAKSYAAVSCALGGLLLALAAQVYLARFTYLWSDHATFSGITYTEANYLLPGLMIVAVALVVAALIALVNAFARRSLRLLLAALAVPVAIYVVAVILVPAYIQNFIVKPNELGRETPYIEHNIAGTRRGFNLDRIETRDYPADTSIAALNLAENRSVLANIRLWDWRALQDTLRQIQEIRTYYDFPDVDVDRYRINGEMRQMMLAARELDFGKLPEQSRNWVNERLIYTHGYGLTMNPVNEFTPEGIPRFVLSNMPVESSGEIQVTRPEIYFGEKTDTTVYVKTNQREFNYPQGEADSYTAYEGTGGFAVGSGLRRLAVAWVLDDFTKLPFSDDVTAESRVLMHRNINDRVRRLAPFLVYDNDPYIVVSGDGRLFWMIDAFTTAERFPYSRHFNVGGRFVNYLRNSVKVTIDAYNGAVNFYVFDAEDPVINAYRGAFPSLFRDAAEMPAGLRAHVRYPETLIKAQGEVYSLYHTQNPKVFFGREDVWSVAREAALSEDTRQQQTQPLDPYSVLMQLPGEQASAEFAQILPFTPANRNNMISWMAGRSDGDVYGSLLVYNFPQSRVIDGPSQVEARIDQDAQLSGQITLWNQQGSKVRRGNLIVMPIGTGLLYVEPIYLQAQRSPMPELRLVVLATQERLAYGESFEVALGKLFGETAGGIGQSVGGRTPGTPPEAEGAAVGQPPATITTAPDLIRAAAQHLSDYQRLTAEGRLGEAGQKLEELKRTLEELQRQQR